MHSFGGADFGLIVELGVLPASGVTNKFAIEGVFQALCQNMSQRGGVADLLQKPRVFYSVV
jgi:hypothetical protein